MPKIFTRFLEPSTHFLSKRFCINFPNNIGQDKASLYFCNNKSIKRILKNLIKNASLFLANKSCNSPYAIRICIFIYNHI